MYFRQCLCSWTVKREEKPTGRRLDSRVRIMPHHKLYFLINLIEEVILPEMP